MSRVVQSDPNIRVPDGVDAVNSRIDPGNALLISPLNGELTEQSRIGNVFYAAHQALYTPVSVGLTATFLGLCISNPQGNNKDLVIQAFSMKIASVAQPAVTIFGIQGGWSAAGVTAHTAALVFGTDFACLNIGSGAKPSANVDSAATTVNPRLLLPLGGAFTAAAFGSDTPSYIDVKGAIIVQPGGWVGTYALTAGIMSVQAAFWWTEVPR
jgi:hypothetical protein